MKLKCLFYGNGLEEPEWLAKNGKSESGNGIHAEGRSSEIYKKEES